MDDFISPNGYFVRIHRSLAVNANYIKTIGITTVNVAGKELPLQKDYRKRLLQAVQSVK